MTFRETMVEALRRLGCSEEDILCRIQIVEREVNPQGASTYLDAPMKHKGKAAEERAIQKMIAVIEVMIAHPELASDLKEQADKILHSEISQN